MIRTPKPICRHPLENTVTITNSLNRSQSVPNEGQVVSAIDFVVRDNSKIRYITPANFLRN